jgi:hypothetical protein
MPLWEWGVETGGQYRAQELFSDESFLWTGDEQLVRLDPQVNPAMVFSIQKWVHQDFVEAFF